MMNWERFWRFFSVNIEESDVQVEEKELPINTVLYPI
jgi:hypothetical protein